MNVYDAISKASWWAMTEWHHDCQDHWHADVITDTGYFLIINRDEYKRLRLLERFVTRKPK